MTVRSEPLLCEMQGSTLRGNKARGRITNWEDFDTIQPRSRENTHDFPPAIGFGLVCAGRGNQPTNPWNQVPGRGQVRARGRGKRGKAGADHWRRSSMVASPGLDEMNSEIQCSCVAPAASTPSPGVNTEARVAPARARRAPVCPVI